MKLALMCPFVKHWRLGTVVFMAGMALAPTFLLASVAYTVRIMVNACRSEDSNYAGTFNLACLRLTLGSLCKLRLGNRRNTEAFPEHITG